MLERFQGKDGRAALLNALRSQFLVDGSSEIADLIVSASQIKEFAPGTALFTQGERSSDLYFILAGQVSVRVDDREIATCSAGILSERSRCSSPSRAAPRPSWRSTQWSRLRYRRRSSRTSRNAIPSSGAGSRSSSPAGW